jgi:hypothetical protein
MWAEKFGLPPNDARLLSLTLREAAEQVFELRAFNQYIEDRAEKTETKSTSWSDFDTPVAEVRTDAAARAIADTPHLTGDPEWDAVELAETDPSRPLLSERMGG